MRSAYNKILEEFSTLEQNTKGQNLYVIKAIKILVVSNDRLENTIKEADKQSRKLEMSNYRLQWAMLMVTSLATAVVIYPYLKDVLISTNLAPKDWKVIIDVLSYIFSAIISGVMVFILTTLVLKRKLRMQRKALREVSGLCYNPYDPLRHFKARRSISSMPTGFAIIRPRFARVRPSLRPVSQGQPQL